MQLDFTPPALTESWATAYLQILATSFVFALAIIPALASQLIVPDDLRHVAHRIRFKRWLISVVFIFVIAILLVWLMQSLSAKQDFRDKYGSMMSYTAILIVAFTPILAALSGVLAIYEFKRNRVTPRIERGLKKFFDKNNHLDSKALDDLLHLGAQGKEGADKKMVLDAIAGVAEHIQNLKEYKGRELKSLIPIVAAIVNKNEQPGDESNFAQASDILSKIFSRHSSDARISSTDAAITILTFRQLVSKVVEKNDEALVLKYLDQAALYSDDIIFEMGLSALLTGHFMTASAALNKLEALTQESGRALHDNRSKLAELATRKRTTKNAQADRAMDEMEALIREQEIYSQKVMANLLGLIAHFATHGPSADKRAAASITQNKKWFLPGIEACFEMAFEYHYTKGAYKTSDELARFSLALRSNQ